MASIWDWSKTAGNNDTADSDINWQENQVPSTVNNSARQMMGRAAEILDDLGAVTSTTNLANVYTLTANSAFTALADGLIVGFKASATNTGAATLNVNALGSKAIRRIGPTADVAIEAGAVVSGQKYLAIYDSAANSAAGAWMLLNPRLVSMTTAPTTGALGVVTGNATLEVQGAGTASDAAYMMFHRPAAFAAYFGLDIDNKLKVGGYSFGAVDHEIYHEGNRELPLGTKMLFFQAAAPTGWTQTTHNNAALRVTSGAGGGTGGSVGFTTLFGRTATDAHTLTTAEIPAHAHTGATGPMNSNSSHSHTNNAAYIKPASSSSPDFNAFTGSDAGFGTNGLPNTTATNTDHTHNFTTNNAGGGGSHSHNIDMRVIYMDVICCERTS